MNYSITQFGKPLDKSLYTMDEENKMFSSNENDLVLNFKDLHGWSFKINSKCTLTAGYNCTIHADSNCIFETQDSCVFKTGSKCIFDTDCNCTFNVHNICTFETGYYCDFNTGSDCSFNTGSNCTFNTHGNCIFETRDTCAFKTSSFCIFKTGNSCAFNIFNDFNKIKTEGNSTVLIRNKKIHAYLEEEIEIYFKNNEILYTKNKWIEDKYKMMKELIK